MEEAEESETSWFMYVLRCSDDTLYTGITTDIDRRIDEHNSSAKGAKYTRARRPVRLEAFWSHESHSAAASAEYAFKQLTRAKKLQKIAELD